MKGLSSPILVYIGWVIRLQHQNEFLLFLRWMTCSMRNVQNMCETKIFRLQSMPNAIICVDERVWNHLSWPVVYIAWSWNSTGVPARKQKTSRFKIARYDDSYFVLFGIRRVAVGRVRWVPMQQSTETLCLQNCCSAWKKRQHATWQGLLRCTSLSAKLVECTCLS